MREIREILNGLPVSLYDEIMAIFNNELVGFIEYEEGRFIGVDIDPVHYPRLKIEQQRGKWSSGKIECEKQSDINPSSTTDGSTMNSETA